MFRLESCVRIPVTQVTTLLLLVHAWFGCCAHHAHTRGVSCFRPPSAAMSAPVWAGADLAIQEGVGQGPGVLMVSPATFSGRRHGCCSHEHPGKGSGGHEPDASQPADKDHQDHDPDGCPDRHCEGDHCVLARVESSSVQAGRRHESQLPAVLHVDATDLSFRVDLCRRPGGILAPAGEATIARHLLFGRLLI